MYSLQFSSTVDGSFETWEFIASICLVLCIRMCLEAFLSLS